MGIDAILPSVPESQSGNKGGKMDCMKSEGKNAQNAESCTPGVGLQLNTEFSETYNKIALSNILASIETVNKAATDGESDVAECDSDATLCYDFYNEFQLVNDQLEVPDLNETELTLQSNVNMEIASELIRSALTEISEKLNLPSCDPENFNLSKITESTVEQFAEIVHVLKQIVAALEKSLSGGEHLSSGRDAVASGGDAVASGGDAVASGGDAVASGRDAVASGRDAVASGRDAVASGNNEIELNETAVLVSNLRIDQFKIEMATQLLGVAADVQNAVALKAEQTFTSGISQAVNPVTITASVEQINKLFGDIIGASENKVLSDVSKDTIQKVTTGSIVFDTKQAVSVQHFDTVTYRALLKVDNTEGVQKEPVSAGDQSKTTSLLSEALTSQPVNDNVSNVKAELVVTDQNSQMQVNSAQDSTRTQVTAFLNKTVDDSEVIGQLTGKFYTIARSGNSEVRIQLKPESLGEVKILIRVEGDIVSARILVESQQVRQIVENNIQTLKDALAQHNLTATSIDVNVGKEGMEGEMANWGNRGFEKNNRGSDKTNIENSIDSGSEHRARFLIGTDTGGRYGNNSIEYFA